MNRVHLTVQQEYKPGDPAPTGYLEWHAWAGVQHKAGLRQSECGRCGKWNYPQEMSKVTDTFEGKKHSGPVTITTQVCLKCAAPAPAPAPGGTV